MKPHMGGLMRSAAGLLLVALAGCFNDGSSSSSSGSSAVVSGSYESVASDGTALHFDRWSPLGGSRFQEPILLIHGFMESTRMFDLEPEHSLGRTLAAAGFDVWAVDLRGYGRSERPPVTDLFGWTWSYDDHVHKDVPAAVRHVLAQTGAPQLFLGGHSLGGMIAYAYLETEDASRVKGVVNIAGPALLDPGGFMGLMTAITQIAGITVNPLMIFDTSIPFATLLRNLLGNNDALWLNFGRLLRLSRAAWNPDNMSAETVAHLMRYMVSDIATNVLKQSFDWSRYSDIYTYGPSHYTPDWGRTSDYYEQHGFMSYLWSIRQVSTPHLVLAGAADQPATPESVKMGFDLLSSADKTYVLFSKANGYSHDYGHMDLVLGQTAPTEVYPVIVNWLTTRGSRR